MNELLVRSSRRDQACKTISTRSHDTVWTRGEGTPMSRNRGVRPSLLALVESRGIPEPRRWRLTNDDREALERVLEDDGVDLPGPLFPPTPKE